MTKEEIRRTVIPQTLVLQALMPADLSVTLYDEAASELGYQRPDTSSTKKDAAAPTPLQETLAHFQIPVLDWRDVLRYQTERKHEADLVALEEEVAQKQPATWRETFEWRQDEISRYKGVIPAEVLEKALKIKRVLPSVEFQVEYLTKTADPFLLARVKLADYQWETYYIDVWDEPRFERQTRWGS